MHFTNPSMVPVTHLPFVDSQVKKIAREEFSYSAYEDVIVNPYVAGFFEGLLVYAAALNTTLRENGSITDGRHIRRNMWNRTFGCEYRGFVF